LFPFEKHSTSLFISGDLSANPIIQLTYKITYQAGNRKTPWLSVLKQIISADDRRGPQSLLPTYAGKGCCVVSATDPYCR
jgi:hypothetical protein